MTERRHSDRSYETALARLLIHSPLPKPNNESLDQSFTFGLYKADRDGSPPPLELADDIIACLQVANHEYNGAEPSMQNRKSRKVVDDLEYAISGIITMSLQYHIRWTRRNKFSANLRDALAHATYLIAYAWDQLLAGDIEDLVEFADLELE